MVGKGSGVIGYAKSSSVVDELALTSDKESLRLMTIGVGRVWSSLFEVIGCIST